jgi:hypothetical protein
MDKGGGAPKAVKSVEAQCPPKSINNKENGNGKT